MTLTAVVKTKGWVATFVVAGLAWTVACVGVGRFIQMDAARTAAMLDVEEKIQYSAMTGQPFVFNAGRMGVIVDTKTFKNGKTVAYRVISFVLPEDVEMRWAPVSMIRRPAAFKTKKRRPRTHPISAPVASVR